MSIAYFCTKTGVRLVAPGKSKRVDPINGVDEFKPAPKAETKTEPAEGKKKPSEGGK
jgi:hypothetical protein